jgi:hypothetical protein
MQTEHNIPLTTAEMASLWMLYMGESMTVCVLRHFYEKAEDPEIKAAVKEALTAAHKTKEHIENIYRSEAHVIPHGMTEKDVYVDAPRLYSDAFILTYLRHMTRFSLKGASLALGMATREDMIDFFEQTLSGFMAMGKMCTSLLARKGLLMKPPYSSVPKEISFVQSNRFIHNWFGPQRTLLMQEASHLFGNIQTNAIGKALLLGFCQTARDEELRKLFQRGVKLAEKHINVLSDIMKEDYVPNPMTWDAYVTSSTMPAFSDKLMLFHSTFINNIGLGDYGDAISSTIRGDIAIAYARLAAETLAYSEDIGNVMIKNGWLEQAPLTDDRHKLAGV